MRKIKHFALMLMTAFMVACTGEPENAVVKPQEPGLKGDLKDYYQVVDKEYTIVKTDGFITSNLITVELARTNQDLPFGEFQVEGYGTTLFDVKDYYQVGFGIELLDESGNVITKKAATATGLSGVYSDDDVTELASLSPNETGSIRWSFDDEEIKNVKTFRISSAYKSASGASSSESASPSSDFDQALDQYEALDASSSESSSSSSDFDQILDQYETLMDEYISVMKKVKAGNTDVMTEAMSIMKKSEKLSKDLQVASSQLSAKQAARYAKIAAKFTSAAASI